MKTPKKPKNTAIVFVRMTPQEKGRLHAIAHRHNMSAAEVVRDALAYYVPATRRVRKETRE